MVKYSQYIIRVHDSFLSYGFVVKHIRLKAELCIDLMNCFPYEPDTMSYESPLVFTKGLIQSVVFLRCRSMNTVPENRGCACFYFTILTVAS